MPIYAYKCSSCGHAADVLQKMSADALTDCPSCGQSSYAKQVTAPSFQLKGSGWYVTDFKGEKKPAAATDAKTESAVDKSDTAAKENTKESTKENTKISTNESTKESPAKSATESSSTAAASTSIPTPTSAPAKPAVANA